MIAQEPIMRPRVFVSSVMEGFEECREAARRAITAIGGDAVMAEDFVAASSSPRNSCLDGVASSDVYVLMVGTRGGWKTPSGRLAVEEEYDEARRLNKIISAYIQDVPRDSDAESLVKKVSNYVGGHFRASFGSCAELETVMSQQLSKVLQPLTLPVMDPNEVMRRAEKCHTIQYETTARLVIAPERSEEIIDRLEIGEQRFEQQVVRIANDTGFFDYRAGKEIGLRGDTLVLEHAESRRAGSGFRRIEIEPSGVMTFDALVSTRESDPIGGGIGHMFILVREHVATPLDAAFRTAGKLYAEIDAYLRHQRFHYGVAFCGVGSRKLADAIPRQSGFGMDRDISGPLTVEKSRLVLRQVLEAPGDEVARIVKLLERMIGAKS